MPKKKKPLKRPLGIYMCCDEDEKKRIDRARRFTRRTWTGYLIEATMKQVEHDEAEMKRKGLI